MGFGLESLVPIAVYVIMGLAMYRMAAANGIAKPWLAWIPLGTDYIMGSVAEKCDAHLGKQGKSYRKILLGLAIASVCGVVVLGILLGVLMIALFAGMDLDFSSLLTGNEAAIEAWAEELMENSDMMEQMTGAAMDLAPMLIVFAVLGLAVGAVSIVYQVYYFIAMSHIFARYAPARASTFTTLGVLGTLLIPTIGSLTVPIFMLCLAYSKQAGTAAGGPGAENPFGDTYWAPNAAPAQPQAEPAPSAEDSKPAEPAAEDDDLAALAALADLAEQKSDDGADQK